jgi:choline dehydrogenase
MNKKVDEKFVRSSTATGYLGNDVFTQGNEFMSDEFGDGRRQLTIFAKATVIQSIFILCSSNSLAATKSNQTFI